MGAIVAWFGTFHTVWRCGAVNARAEITDAFHLGALSNSLLWRA